MLENSKTIQIFKKLEFLDNKSLWWGPSFISSPRNSPNVEPSSCRFVSKNTRSKISYKTHQFYSIPNSDPSKSPSGRCQILSNNWRNTKSKNRFYQLFTQHESYYNSQRSHDVSTWNFSSLFKPKSSKGYNFDNEKRRKNNFYCYCYCVYCC